MYWIYVNCEEEQPEQEDGVLKWEQVNGKNNKEEEIDYQWQIQSIE